LLWLFIDEFRATGLIYFKGIIMSKKFLVVADVFFGGRHKVKSFKKRKQAQEHADSLHCNGDMYTSFSVCKKSEANLF